MSNRISSGGHPSDTWKDGVFPSGKCMGGEGGKSGGGGAMRVSYLNYNKGGGGGGAGVTNALVHQFVEPNEPLTVKVGRGGKGGTAGIIEENGNIKTNTTGEDSTYNTTEAGGGVTKITRDSKENILLFATCYLDKHNCGPISGSNDGNAYYLKPFYNKGGWIYATPIAYLKDSELNLVEGFINEDAWGHVAGNKKPASWVDATEGSGPKGGDGGKIGNPWYGECTPGKGGTKPGEKGGNASGFGCGGGGGYALADGGAGSGGYVRISWNKYWDAAQKAYKYAEIGAGGGGASGNVLKYTVDVKSGDVIKIRIGQGGKGGDGTYISSSEPETKILINGQKGGDTVFAVGKSTKEGNAGGGGGGFVPSNDANNNYALINGTGGNISTLCSAKGVNMLNVESSCTRGAKGGYPEGNAGGNGTGIASKLIYGKTGYAGGNGGIAGNNSNGKTGSGYGTGGGGAGLFDMGMISSAQSSANNSKGGDGANGKIILRWRE